MIDTTLRKTLVQLLGPLVGYLIGRGWGYGALRDLLKEIYVAEAEKQQRKGSAGEPTDSQISLVTGIHRKEIKRLREALPPEDEKSDQFSGRHAGARVIATWITSPEFLDGGSPAKLPLRAPAGKASFEALVLAARADMRPRAVLDELVRIGAVEEDKDECVRLVQTAYVSPLPQDKMAFLAANVGDHLRSALHNLTSPEKPLFERALFHDSISQEQLDAARPEMLKLAEELLKKANQQLIDANTISTEAKSEQRKRMRLGVFYYETDEDDES